MAGIVDLVDERNWFGVCSRPPLRVGLVGSSLDSLQDELECCYCDAVDGGCQVAMLENRTERARERERERERAEREREEKRRRREREAKIIRVRVFSFYTYAGWVLAVWSLLTATTRSGTRWWLIGLAAGRIGMLLRQCRRWGCRGGHVREQNRESKREEREREQERERADKRVKGETA
jgi:hypothetical protein